MTIIEKQKYDLAKFLRLIFLVPPNENTSSRIKPIKGIENNNSYPKYPPHRDRFIFIRHIFIIHNIFLLI
ncbi:MAG: hypothetical protein L6V91_01115 [Bacilli bacterium]|nr:MAG: hypothetical protein L6V91_01115 [Bacilli bacterium]